MKIGSGGGSGGSQDGDRMFQFGGGGGGGGGSSFSVTELSNSPDASEVQMTSSLVDREAERAWLRDYLADLDAQHVSWRSRHSNSLGTVLEAGDHLNYAFQSLAKIAGKPTDPRTLWDPDSAVLSELGMPEETVDAARQAWSVRAWANDIPDESVANDYACSVKALLEKVLAQLD